VYGYTDTIQGGRQVLGIRKAALKEHGSHRQYFEAALCSKCEEAMRTIGDAFKNARVVGAPE
jgi:hypothetical protein